MTERKRYFIELQYNGRHYHGWQIQPNALSVQEVLTKNISKLLGNETVLIGCGRTDTGVHASQFYVHFDADPSRLQDNFIFRLNRMLPHDIAVLRLIDNVPEKAHSRFDAVYRAYDYHIHFNKNPFLYKQSLYYTYGIQLNREAMEQAVALLPQYKDFVMFCKTGGNQKTTLCELYKTELDWQDQTQQLRFHIAANRFLRGMVRRIVGCLLMIGKEKMSLEHFKEVMDNAHPQFEHLNLSVPSQGLFLTEVRYPYISF